MSESISVPISGSFEYKENTGSQMKHANKKKLLDACICHLLSVFFGAF
jgi:hypothetical protein